MKTLITGVSGQLGKALSGSLSGTEFLGVDAREMDITDPSAVKRVMKGYQPDVVIHTAAYTDVDGAEANQEQAYRVNALGTQNVALACHNIGAAMALISTDYVFDGKTDRPFDEYDLPAPLNVYGKTKFAGEALARQHVGRLFIVRTSWLFGDGNNFVRTILRVGYQQKTVKVVNDQFGCPTYTKDLAAAIIDLINTNHFGVYHVVNQGITTWFDFAREIFRAAGAKPVDLIPQSTAELGRAARRPMFSALNDNLLRLATGRVMRPWQDALQEYLSADPVIRGLTDDAT